MKRMTITPVYKPNPMITMWKRWIISKNSVSIFGRTREDESSAARFLMDVVTILTTPDALLGAMFETFAHMNANTPCVLDATPSPAILSESIAPLILSTATPVSAASSRLANSHAASATEQWP